MLLNVYLPGSRFDISSKLANDFAGWSAPTAKAKLASVIWQTKAKSFTASNFVVLA